MTDAEELLVERMSRDNLDKGAVAQCSRGLPRSRTGETLKNLELDIYCRPNILNCI